MKKLLKEIEVALNLHEPAAAELQWSGFFLHRFTLALQVQSGGF